MRRRRSFLESELAKERATLDEVKTGSGMLAVAAELMVSLSIRHFEVELAWLNEMEARLLSER